ncbi:MAG: argininosuccinate lyase, partial [Erysipelotrichaceae bacterium]
PQKKNPDICELIRGKSGRVYGSLVSLLTVFKSLPLAYNKDMQEDKEAIFNAIDSSKQCLEIINPMFDSLSFNKENMQKSASKGFINATDLADYLVKKGLPFRDAYYISGKLVAFCLNLNKTLNELTIEEFRQFSELFDNDVYDYIDLNYCLHQRKALGGPAPEDVQRQIETIESFLKKKDK